MPAYMFSCKGARNQHRYARIVEEQRRVTDASPPPRCPTCRREMVPYISAPPAAIIKNPAAGYKP